ncbi:MAG: alpha/beta hydrolase [Actinomycetota bacterium]
MRARAGAPVVTVSLAVCAALAACGSGSNRAGPTTAAESASAPVTSSVAPPTPDETPSQLPLDPRNRHSTAVTFPSSDGITLAGRLYGNGPHGVVLAHMGSPRNSQFDWLPVAVKLAARGYRVLTFDYRGICFAPDPNVGCSQGEIDWPNAWQDVNGAVDFLRTRGASKVIVVGADLGGSMALYAAAQGVKVDGVVAVSGLDEAEGYLIGEPVLRGVDVPLLFIAGSQDEPAASTYRRWSKEVHEPASGLLLDTDLHGTFLFDPIAPSDAALAARAMDVLLRFLQAKD